MFGNRLKRKDLSNKYDYYHVKNKINDKKQALIYLDELLNYLNQFDYYYDDNFIFGGRKKYLYDEIVRIIRNEQKEKEPLYFVLGSLEEFMFNGNMLNYNDVDKDKWINGKIIDGKDFVELRNKDDLYTNSGYICKQEKLKIIEIIDMIKKYIVDDMEEKDMGLFNKKDKYNIDAEDNRPQIVYGVPDAIRKQWEEEAKAKQDEAKEKYDIEPEDNLPREVYGIPNWLQEKRKNEDKDKYDINPEDNVPQKVYGVPNYDFSQDKIKKESINIVVENYCLSLTKWDNKCDLLYVNNSKTSYIKDSIVSIPITKFDKFCNRLKTIIADWNTEYSGDKNIVWKLKININGLNKQINGNGAFPKNWNEFIDLLSEYEILFKKVLSFDKEGNDEKTVNIKNNYGNKTSAVTLYIRDDQPKKNVGSYYNQFDVWRTLEFTNNKLHIKGASYSYGMNLSTVSKVERKIIFENKETLKTYTFDLGSITNGLYKVALPESDNLDKTRAWYDATIDISKLEKGTYSIFITTKSNLTDFSELNDNLRRSLTDKKATINNKDYQFILDTKNGNNIELVVS